MAMQKVFAQVWADRRKMFVVLTGLAALLGVSCQANADHDRLQMATASSSAISSAPPSRPTLAPENKVAPTVTVTLHSSATSTFTIPSPLVPTIRGYAGYPVTDTKPGGITILSKGEIIVVPNPVKSPPAQWKIYTEPFYSYTLAYPPEWFLTEPADVQRLHGIPPKIVLGLSASISSVDLSKAPGTEPRTLNPQDALHIEVSLEEEPLRSDESLKDYLLRQDWYWPESIKRLELFEQHGLPAMFIHYDYSGLIPNGGAGSVILIAAKDGRVYKLIAAPDPDTTIYPEVFQHILDSFTILKN